MSACTQTLLPAHPCGGLKRKTTSTLSPHPTVLAKELPSLLGKANDPPLTALPLISDGLGATC